MDPTTKEGREALRGLLSRATEDPWQSLHQNDLNGLCTIVGAIDGPDDGRYRSTVVCEVNEEPDAYEANAELIAATPTILKSALSHIEKLEAERDALRADLERAREACIDASAIVENWIESPTVDAFPLAKFRAAFSPSPAPVETPPTVGTIVMSPTDFEKFKRAIDPSPEPYEPRKRPKGSNADEWQLFLVEHANASAFLAVQIAEAIDDASKGARA